MSTRRFFLTFAGLTLLLVACSQARPTPLALPTRTPLPPTPTAAPTATTTATPVAATSPAASPTPAPVEPTATETSATSTPPPDTPDVQEQAFPPRVALEPLLSGLQAPVYLTHAGQTGAWAAWLFVVEKAGRILLVRDGQLQPTPFLDITERVGSSASEQGLLSVAFAPDFDNSGLFYVNYTDRNGDTVVSRLRLLQSDPPQGDPASEQKLLEIAQPAGNHNGGQLQFGPDGYLYVGTGDGGRAGDPWGNAQNPDALLGKMLRLDVTGAETYEIPADNPFVGWTDVRPEIWALGLRNPWRFSFDRATDELYIADVGQNVYEEVNVQPAGSTGGENYGWDFMEGVHCFEPASGCDPAGLILPVAEYDHSQGCSITGGYVYRGARYPQLAGVYFFGDYCSGLTWGLRQRAPGEWQMALLLDTGASISSFGQDASGELYVLDYAGGTVYQLVAQP